MSENGDSASGGVIGFGQTHVCVGLLMMKKGGSSRYNDASTGFTRMIVFRGIARTGTLQYLGM